MTDLLHRYLWFRLPKGGNRQFVRRNFRTRPELSALVPKPMTRGMESRMIALDHEFWRLFRVGEPIGGLRAERIRWLSLKALAAAEGGVIRSKITNYPNWLRPIRVERDTLRAAGGGRAARCAISGAPAE